MSAMLIANVTLLVVVLGMLVLRWQRDRQQFLLQKAAIEKGLTILPDGVPVWVASLRKGLVVMALGVGMLVGGYVGINLAAQVPEPPRPAFRMDRAAVRPQPAPAPEPAGDERALDRPQFAPPPPMDRMGGPGFRPGPGGNRDMADGRENSQDRNLGPVGQGGPGMRGPDPLWEKWRQAQDQKMISFGLLVAGGILTLVGFVMTVFALIERRVLAGSPRT